jgi:hypothetical protein
LESFTKTFGLGEIKKGYFPHAFNRRENFIFKGLYPAAAFYKPEYFSNSKKLAFEKWHEESKNLEFDFQKELRGYCWSDVSLLSEGCIKFSEINKEASKVNEGIDPLESNLTISSFCNKLFIKKYMKKDSIAWVPANGYDPKQKTSLEAIKYISEKENIANIVEMVVKKKLENICLTEMLKKLKKYLCTRGNYLIFIIN